MDLINKQVKINLVKNFFVLIISFLFYPFIKQSIEKITSSQINDFLLIISLLLVTVCFANFAFTYEKSNLKRKFSIFLSHFTTGWFMLLTALLIECIVIVTEVVYPNLFNIVFLLSTMLYFGIILYDFWDLLRSELL